MRLVPLTRGLFAKVDDQDYERVAALSWYARFVKTKSRTIFYATRTQRIPNSTQKVTIHMHSFILNYDGCDVIDHFDDDGLNNQRSNLSVIPQSYNLARARKQAGRSSPFKGVSWYPLRDKWRVRVKLNGIEHFVGYFSSEVDAATAYNFAALGLFGEFARMNIPLNHGVSQ